MTTVSNMLHSNIGEVHQLLSTFNRVWGAGGEASLSLKTVDGKVSAVLEVQLGPLLFLTLELQEHANRQLEVLTSSLVNAADVVVVLDARHEMLLGRKPGGSAVWKASQPDSSHPYLLLKPQQTTLCRALSNLLKGRRTLDLQ